MFNLEQAIAGWRRQMAAGGIASREVLDELEGHLRDEIERQIRSGADEQSAYRSTVSSLGKANELNTEFAKIAEPARSSRGGFWRSFYFMSVTFVLAINTWTLLVYELSLRERVIGFSVVSLICLFMTYLPWFRVSLSERSYELTAKVIKSASSVVWVWAIWLLLNAAHIIHLEMPLVLTMIIWCLYAAVVFAFVDFGVNPRGPQGGGPDAGPCEFPLDPQPIPPTRPYLPEFAGVSVPAGQVDSMVYQYLEAARVEAVRLGHDFIGTEHLLLAILQSAKGSFANVLHTLKVDCEWVRVEIGRLVPAEAAHAPASKISFTPRACRAIRLAANESKILNHSTISAEHVFLGLLLEGDGVASRVLKKCGVRLKKSRYEILRESRGGSTC